MSDSISKYKEDADNTYLEGKWKEANDLMEGLKGKQLHKMKGYGSLKSFKENAIIKRAMWYKAGEEKATKPGTDPPTGVKKYSVSWAMAPDKTLSNGNPCAPFCVASQAGFISVVDAYSGAVMKPMAKLKYVMEAAISPSADVLIGGGMDNNLTIFKTNVTGSKFLPPTKVLKDPDLEDCPSHEGYISAITFVGEDKLLSASGDAKAKLWDLTAGEIVRTFHGHVADCTGLCRDNDDPNIFGTSSTDKSTRVWDMRAPVAVRKFMAKYSTNCCTMLPQSKGIASGCDNASWEVYDIGSAQQAARGKVKKGRCESMACSKSGRVLYMGWDFPIVGLVVADTFCPDNQAKLGDNRDAHADLNAKEVKAHGEECIKSLSMSMDGHGLLSAGFDGLVRLWTKTPA